MYSKFFSNTSSTTYAPVWSKYRPAILQLMVAASEKPQTYKLFKHEFIALNPKEKSGLHFNLTAFQGKALNTVKQHSIGRDLLDVLVNSKKAVELMNTDTYEFALDKQFVLHVKRLQPVVPEVAAVVEEKENAEG